MHMRPAPLHSLIRLLPGRRWVGAVLMLLFAASMFTTNASTATPGRDVTRRIQVGAIERHYRVHLPPNLRADAPAPVLLAFHGGGGHPDSMARLSGLDAKADAAGFVLVYPFGTGPAGSRNLSFNGGECCAHAMQQNIDDIAFVRALLDDLPAVAAIDPRRVYATGLSNGGIMAHRLAAELSESIAAIASVGGPLMLPAIRAPRPVPVKHIHGRADAFAPYDGGYGQGVGGTRGVTRFRSVAQTLEAWRRHNQCAGEPVSLPLPNPVDDGMTSRRHEWPRCAAGVDVVLIEIEGGGHTWPGMPPLVAALGPSTRDFAANDVIWDFVSRHRLPESAKPVR